MNYEVALLVFGILLLLVGLVGKVKAKELEVGTSSRMARIVMALLGTLLIIFSFNTEMPATFISKFLKQNAGDEPAQRLKEGVYTIQQKFKGRYLDAYTAGSDYKVVTRDKQNNTTQKWKLTPLVNENDTYTIQQDNNGRYLDAYTAGPDYKVVTRDKQNSDTQKWLIKIGSE